MSPLSSADPSNVEAVIDLPTEQEPSPNPIQATTNIDALKRAAACGSPRALAKLNEMDSATVKVQELRMWLERQCGISAGKSGEFAQALTDSGNDTVVEMCTSFVENNDEWPSVITGANRRKIQAAIDRAGSLRMASIKTTTVEPSLSEINVEMPAIEAPAPLAIARESPEPMCATEAEAMQWATRWWAGYEAKVKAHDAELYASPEGLHKQLEPRGTEHAPVKLVRLSALLKRADQLRAAKTNEERRALKLPRRQELEEKKPHVFLTPEEVRRLGRGHAGFTLETCGLVEKEIRPLKILSISHGWLTHKHPDPLGQQLVAFAEQVRRERRMLKWWDHEGEFDTEQCCFDVCSYPLCCGIQHGCCCWVVPYAGQQCCHCHQQLPSGEMAVFYDFTSLHQKDAHGERTPAESAAFDAALETMGVWYAHQLTTSVIMSRLPAGWPERPEDAPNFPPGWLKAKGWPTFERAVSAHLKPSARNIWRRIVDPEGRREGDSAYREAPAHPKAFAARLARAIFTNGKKDCERVAGLYADTIAGGFGRARRLEFEDAMWTDEEAVQLAEVLPFAHEVRFLNLFGNKGIGHRGLGELAVAIRGGAAPKLEEFKFDDNWGAKADSLHEACKGRGIHVYTSG